MSTPLLNAVLLLAVGVGVFALVVSLRSRFGGLTTVDTAPWSSTLSYVATAYGVVVGFSILFLFGQFGDARQAVGDEATSIGTAFEEAALFPGSSDDIQQALICYGVAVPQYDWPALQERRGAPEVDQAFSELVGSLAENDEAPVGALHAAAATNLVSQIGSISTARETRLVAAETQVPTMLWALLFGGGLFVLGLIFVVTLPAERYVHASLVAMSAVFTVVMLVLVLALSTPFAEGSGRVSPRLIEETVASMQASAPTLTDCDTQETP
jgi:hypothetical protein